MIQRVSAILALMLSGCATSRPATDSVGPTAQSHENLHSTLWSATAAEYDAVAMQAYRIAGLMLENALGDSTWTASVEQAENAGFGSLPPAVVLDVDETVLDNTTYQARLIRDGEVFSGRTWAAWVAEAAAVPVPGALDFTRRAAEMGVRVVYLTNRDADGEEATRANLKALGFPVGDDPDAVLTQGERPDWRPSDKTPRRRHVSERYRVLLLVGDNLGDFTAIGRYGIARRDSIVASRADWWGTRWIVLPNPQYGSWEAASFNHEYALPADSRRDRKIELLKQRADS